MATRRYAAPIAAVRPVHWGGLAFVPVPGTNLLTTHYAGDGLSMLGEGLGVGAARFASAVKTCLQRYGFRYLHVVVPPSGRPYRAMSQERGLWTRLERIAPCVQRAYPLREAIARMRPFEGDRDPAAVLIGLAVGFDDDF